ncbi:MAG: cytochrome c biogenesis protein CcsA [Gemmatimonadaceae bacterium]
MPVSTPARVPALPYRLFGVASFALLIACQVIGFLISPADRDMGHLQKIMYVHVAAAWNMMIAFFIVAISSLLYLWKGQEKHDLLAAAAAEVGAVLTALTLALGSIWARPTWGIWWTWDARLTSTAVLLLIFVGYLALRSFVEDVERRAQWSAAVGILGALNVPIVYMSVKWWRTLHQPQSSPSTVDPYYVLSLRANAIAFMLVTIYFIMTRYKALRWERAAEREDERAVMAGEPVHA